MLIIKEISAKGVPVLDTYRLQLNKHPLSVIRGRNLDKKRHQSKNANSSNGSGKTLSVSPIPTIIYQSTPNSLKKKGTKDLLRNKNSEITLKLNDGRDRTIREVLTSSVKYSIETDGKVKHYRESTEAKEQIQKMFPISEEQFYTQIFIDGRQKTILQSGTAAQRFSYLETVFRLNEYDRINSLITKDYNKIKVMIQELGILVSEQQTRKKDLPIMDLARLRVKQKHVEEEIETLSARVEDYIERHNNIKNYLNLAEDIDDSVNQAQLETELAEAFEESKTMQALYKKSVRYYENLEQQEAIRDRRQRTIQSIKAIPGDCEDVHRLDQKVGRLQERLVRLQTAIEDARNGNAIHNELKESLEALPVQTIPDKYAEHSLDDLKTAKNEIDYAIQEKTKSKFNLERYIEHSHTEQNCPVCQRGLPIKTAKSLIESTGGEIVKLSRRASSLHGYIKIRSIQDRMEHTSFVKVKPLVEEQEALEARVEKLVAERKQLNKKQQLKDLLKELPKPEAIEADNLPKPAVYEDTIQDLNKRISGLENSLRAHRRIERLGFKFKSVAEAKQKAEKYKTKLNEYRPVLQDLQRNLQDLMSKGSVYESISADIDRLVGKIDDLKIETKDFKVLEALRAAFGNKGLRKMKTRYYVQQLQNNFNKYAYLIFGEPIKFLFQLTDTKFDILCEINGQISDARKLSGAESSAFTLLLILCILPFIPDNYRCNALFLDEVESGMDSSSQEKFVNDFLPILNQVVPNIFIITPKSEKEFYIPNSANYLVTKQGGKSTIKLLTPGA
jgi:DNA repair exonuclease SbcCD ATPase subunit